MVIGRGRRREHTQPTFCTTTMEKIRGKKPGTRRTYFRTGPHPDRLSSGHVILRDIADIAQLAVAHTQNILSDRAPVTQLPVT
jgi:hypothetical protein